MKNLFKKLVSKSQDLSKQNIVSHNKSKTTAITPRYRKVYGSFLDNLIYENSLSDGASTSSPKISERYSDTSKVSQGWYKGEQGSLLSRTLNKIRSIFRFLFKKQNLTDPVVLSPKEHGSEPVNSPNPSLEHYDALERIFHLTKQKSTDETLTYVSLDDYEYPDTYGKDSENLTQQEANFDSRRDNSILMTKTILGNIAQGNAPAVSTNVQKKSGKEPEVKSKIAAIPKRKRPDSPRPKDLAIGVRKRRSIAANRTSDLTFASEISRSPIQPENVITTDVTKDISVKDIPITSKTSPIPRRKRPDSPRPKDLAIGVRKRRSIAANGTSDLTFASEISRSPIQPENASIADAIKGIGSDNEYVIRTPIVADTLLPDDSNTYAVYPKAFGGASMDYNLSGTVKIDPEKTVETTKNITYKSKELTRSPVAKSKSAVVPTIRRSRVLEQKGASTLTNSREKHGTGETSSDPVITNTTYSMKSSQYKPNTSSNKASAEIVEILTRGDVQQALQNSKRLYAQCSEKFKAALASHSRTKDTAVIPTIDGMPKSRFSEIREFFQKKQALSEGLEVPYTDISIAAGDFINSENSAVSGVSNTAIKSPTSSSVEPATSKPQIAKKHTSIFKSKAVSELVERFEEKDSKATKKTAHLER